MVSTVCSKFQAYEENNHVITCSFVCAYDANNDAVMLLAGNSDAALVSFIRSRLVEYKQYTKSMTPNKMFHAL